MAMHAPSRCHRSSLRALWHEAFGDSEAFLDAFEQTAFSFDRCRCVTVGDTVVAALYWLDCFCRGARMAYLYAVATAKDYRGQGICSALMEDTHRHLRTLGYEGALLVPSTEALFDFYKQFGYHTCSYMRDFCCCAKEGDVALRVVDNAEYTRLRRQLLPVGGVVQEGASVDFLQTMASLYAGDDFLLAARREGDILCGVELLGNADAAPAIVRALACSEGHFRTPGTDVPFAIYRPLCDPPHASPSYFGLAFD